jgi:hypothetical protein
LSKELINHYEDSISNFVIDCNLVRCVGLLAQQVRLVVSLDTGSGVLCCVLDLLFLLGSRYGWPERRRKVDGITSAVGCCKFSLLAAL